MDPAGWSSGNRNARVWALTLGLVAVLCFGAAPAAARVLRVGSFRGSRGQLRLDPERHRRGASRRLDPDRPRRLPPARRLQPAASRARRRVRRRRARQQGRPAHPRHGPKPRDRSTAPSPAPRRAAPTRSDQTYGPKGRADSPSGRNGIVVDKANGVSIDNLTACNFLGGGQPDLVERRRRLAGTSGWEPGTGTTCPPPPPSTGPTSRRPPTASSRQRARPGAPGALLRVEHERRRRLHRRLPAAVPLGRHRLALRSTTPSATREPTPAGSWC